MQKHYFLATVCLLLLLLAACQDAAAPTPNLPPTPTASTFVTLDLLLKSTTAQVAGQVTTAGYLTIDLAGAALVDGLHFAADGTAQRIDSAHQVWLGTDIETSLKAHLRASGAFLFAPVRVRGQLEGPGAYGPRGSYQFQIVTPIIDVLSTQETTIGDLLDHSADYENRLVRVVGGLIARDSSALLVEQLGPGGLPLPKARQIKLHAPLQDRMLLDQLKGVSGGAIHYGQVQLEGFWQAGGLMPLSIVLVRNG